MAIEAKQDTPRSPAAKRNYIGLATSFHDAALAIVDSAGEIRFAEATERSLQSKRSLCMFPDVVHRAGDLVREHCEPNAEIVIAHSWSTMPPASAPTMHRHMEKWRQVETSRFAEVPPHIRAELASSEHSAMSHWVMTAFSGNNLKYELSRVGWPNADNVTSRRFNHHLTHAVTACHASGFDDALCAIVDGLGEGAACAFYHYRDGRLEQIPVEGERGGSLGLFYQAICLACGFGALAGEEWKVMGLAAYGKRDEKLIELCRRAIQVDGLALHHDSSLELRGAFAEASRVRGAPLLSAADFAHAGQLVFTEVILRLLNTFAEHGGSRNLVLGGGCALNSSANGMILENTPFERLYVFCAPGDDGNAIGAARLAFLEDHPDYKPAKTIQSPYLGSTMSPEAKENVLRFSGMPKRRLCNGDAPRIAAGLLAEEKIIGWVQGRAEFGPRALGNRSILASPRSPKIKDIINSRVKFREEYRPFAPAILDEFGDMYFENYQQSPYMERTLRFRPDVVDRVPGVVHKDGTGRLQSVKADWNPAFHALVSEFHRLTQVPLVLNTSFNVMGKPISHSVEDVMAVFCSTGLDAVFIDDLLIEK